MTSERNRRKSLKPNRFDIVTLCDIMRLKQSNDWKICVQMAMAFEVHLTMYECVYALRQSNVDVENLMQLNSNSATIYDHL